MARSLPTLASAATGVLVGSAIVASRFVIDQSTPASLAFLRYSIGFCVLLPALLLSSRSWFERRDLVPIGLLGIVQFGVLVVLLNYSLQHISSARAALIFATMPLLTMLIASALKLEQLTMLKILGFLLTIIGVGLALGDDVTQGGSAGARWIGEGAAFASALSGAICSILYRPYLRKYPTLLVSGFAMLASVGFLAVLVASEGFFGSAPRFTTEGWLAILFIGISSSLGYYLWLWALAHTSPTNVTVFLALSPVTAAALGALFLGERISTLVTIGVVCVAAGLWLALRSSSVRRGHA